MSVSLAVLLQISVSVQIADTIPARTPTPLVLRATAPGNTAPRLTVPSAAGGTITLVTDVTRIGGGFGQAVATRETRYVLRVERPGTVQLSPVVATLGTEQATSPAKIVFVQPAPVNSVPSIVQRAPLSGATLVNFHSLVAQDTVWAGAQVTYQVGVFIDDELRGRLQRNPEYVAPSVDGAVSYELPVANDLLSSRDADGRRYRPFVFARALFPIRAGLLTIPPARLVYSLGSAGTVFGRPERQTSATRAQQIVVRELPVEGRPKDFAGAVGEYRVTAALERTGARVGDAVQLTVRIEGVGNVKLLPAPRIAIPDVITSPPVETIAVDSSDLRVRGSKSFRFLLTPRREGDLSLGTVEYPFFNPARGDYEVASMALGVMRVAPGSAVLNDDSVAVRAALPLEPWQVAPRSDVTEQLWFRLTLAMLLVPWIALASLRMTAAIRSRSHVGSAHRGRRMPAASPGADIAEVRRGFIEALAPIVHLGPDEPFSVPNVVQRLRRAGVTSDVAEAAGAMLLRLDILTFGGSDPANAERVQALATEALAVQRQLLLESAPSGRRRLAGLSRFAVVAFCCATQAGGQPREFTDGVTEYRQRRYSEAAVAFATAAAREPESPAAWLNLGAAHWMRADTAGAIVAWQRSARLQPGRNRAHRLLAQFSMNADVRSRLAPVSANTAWVVLLSVLALLSVCGGFMWWRNGHVSAGALLVALTLLVCPAALTVFAQHSEDAADLVVIRQDVAMRDEPMLAGEAGARARAGEVGRIRESNATWRYVIVSGGRSGWVESDALRSLAKADGRDVAKAEARIAGESPAP